ncbi:hypothetical protein ILUMI_14088, partial [Ignelater luminosus]
MAIASNAFEVESNYKKQVAFTWANYASNNACQPHGNQPHNFDLIKMALAKTVYITEERIDLIELYIENGRSAAATLRKFKAKYGSNVTLT